MATDYVTLADLKAALGIDDTNDDTALTAAIKAASRQIDNYCGRTFGKSSSETRTFTAPEYQYCPVDDLVTISALVVDSVTWASTDYALGPINSTFHGTPYRWIDGVNKSFSRKLNAVKVTGEFGWSAVPDVVKQACSIQASRLFKRKDAIFGVVGSADMGQQSVIPRIDPDVKMLLMGLRVGPL